MATTYRVRYGSAVHEVSVGNEDGTVVVTVDGVPAAADLQHVDGGLFSLLLDGRSYEPVIATRSGTREITLGGRTFGVEVERLTASGGAGGRGRSGADASRPAQVKSPLTGVIVDVNVSPGESVTLDQVLAVVESMKMNNEIRSPRDGIVATVHVSVGQRVEQGALLAVVE
jgi:biotin carboxyl carrier protein